MLSEILSNRRREIGMSVDQLVEKCGISKSTVSKVLTGVSPNPNIETVKAIAYALGLTLNDLDNRICESNTKSNDFQQSDAEMLTRMVKERGGNELVLSIMLNWLKLNDQQREVLNGFVNRVIADYQRRANNASASEAAQISSPTPQLGDPVINRLIREGAVEGSADALKKHAN